jgi:hypothetical protein
MIVESAYKPLQPAKRPGGKPKVARLGFNRPSGSGTTYRQRPMSGLRLALLAYCAVRRAIQWGLAGRGQSTTKCRPWRAWITRTTRRTRQHRTGTRTQWSGFGRSTYRATDDCCRPAVQPASCCLRRASTVGGHRALRTRRSLRRPAARPLLSPLLCQIHVERNRLLVAVDGFLSTNHQHHVLPHSIAHEVVDA